MRRRKDFCFTPFHNSLKCTPLSCVAGPDAEGSSPSFSLLAQFILPSITFHVPRKSTQFRSDGSGDKNRGKVQQVLSVCKMEINTQEFSSTWEALADDDVSWLPLEKSSILNQLEDCRERVDGLSWREPRICPIIKIFIGFP